MESTEWDCAEKISDGKHVNRKSLYKAYIEDITLPKRFALDLYCFTCDDCDNCRFVHKCMYAQGKTDDLELAQENLLPLIRRR